MPLTHTSEKTVEVNILHDLATCLENWGAKVTIVSPTQPEERDFGFDDIFDSLPSGRIIALQFKRPEEHSPTHAKFKIDFSQLRVLRHNFVNRDEAFYVFCPYPTIAEFRKNRQNLLDKTIIVDVRADNIPLIVNYNLKKVLIDRTNPLDVTFRKRREFVIPRPVYSARHLCPRFGMHLGKYLRPEKEDSENAKYEKDDEAIQNKKIKPNFRGTYLVHIKHNKSRH